MQSPQDLHVTDHPVGIGSRAEELISKLRLDCKDQVLVVGVFGIGGIGKTTIVKATYNRIAAKFDDSCFLAVADIRGRQNWKVKLQKMLISYLTKKFKHTIAHNHNDGVTKIRKLISGQKILLVLDDVDEFRQLEELGINPAWFYNGSRIIVTTRDRQSLRYIPYVSYHTTLLNERESLTLFTRLMFARDDTDNTKFIEKVVSRAGGHPLVLKVWSGEFKQYKKEQWPSILETLKRIPHGDVQKQLQLSYDSLPIRSKKLFLDIVYFFHGMEKELVVKVLHDEDSGFFPDIEIQYLVDKSLVEIYNDGSVSIHQAIREMGQEVVRQENVDEPGQRTRLIGFRDVVRVLRDCSGTKSVESIRLDYWEIKEPVTVQVEAFKKMSNLRFIQLRENNYFHLQRLQWSSSSSSSNDDMYSFSFKKLKYLEWEEFPFKCLDNIDMGNVVFIKLFRSKLEKLWEGLKTLHKLTILDVKYSTSLTNTGNFVGLEKLEKLILRGCKNLEELDGSIGYLEKLVSLDLSSCTQLKSIPNLPPSIEYIKAYSCISLMNLPSNLVELQSLTELNLHSCLKLGSEGFMKVTGLRNLQQLSMTDCNVSHVSSEIGNLVSLQYLDLSHNTFSRLPDSFSNLSELNELVMKDCSQLELLPLLPSNLTFIKARGCFSLDVMPYYDSITAYVFRSKMLEESFFTKDKTLCIGLSGEEVPDWCSYRSNGHVLSFVAPIMHLDNKICGVIICATLTGDSWRYFSPKMLNKTKETSHDFYCSQYDDYDEGSMFIVFCPLNDKTLVVEGGDTVLLQFDKYWVSSWGLRLIYEDDLLDDDSTLLIQKQLTEPPFTLTVPSSETTVAAAASITQLYDDSICSFPFQDKEIIYYNFVSRQFEFFETTLPLEMMTAGATSIS